jgi:hypothetical protein
MAEQNEEGSAPGVIELLDALEIAGMWYHDEDSGRLKMFIAQLTNAETPIIIVLGSLGRLDLRQYDEGTRKKIEAALQLIKSRSARQQAMQCFTGKMGELSEQN